MDFKSKNNTYEKAILLALFFQACLIVSCNKEKETSPNIIGAWIYANNAEKLEQIEFDANAHYSLIKFTEGNKLYEGHYNYTDNEVTLFFDSIPIVGNVHDNKMTFNYGEEKVFIFNDER